MADSKQDLTRRDFLKETAMIAAAAAATRAAEQIGGAAAGVGAGGAGAARVKKLPTIKLGRLEVSRLILGSNPFFGFGHRGAELDEEMKAYYAADERITAVLDEAAGLGITAVAAPCYDRWIELFARYLDKGGKLRIWIAQPDAEGGKMKEAIDAAVNGGAKAVFIQGGRVDEHVSWGRWDVLKDWLERIRAAGLPAGLAAHNPAIHPEAERRGLPTDFYFQCLYQPNKEQYLSEHRELAVETIRKLDKPVVAYKVLAAGRLRPDEAFPYILGHLRAKDGICVGVYPKDKADMIAEDVGLARKWSARAEAGAG